MISVRHYRAYAARTIIALLFVCPSAPMAPAAEASVDPPALQKAGEDYGKGDLQSAWFRFWMLARKGDATAQFNLAQLYREGRGIPADLRLDRYWYGEAAAKGNGYAQFNLGMMYERGDGVPADLIEARAWYRRAASQNIHDAQRALDRLDRKSTR